MGCVVESKLITAPEPAIIKTANTVETKQRDSFLSHEDMNTHEQTDSPGKTTVK